MPVKTFTATASQIEEVSNSDGVEETIATVEFGTDSGALYYVEEIVAAGEFYTTGSYDARIYPELETEDEDSGLIVNREEYDYLGGATSGYQPQTKTFPVGKYFTGDGFNYRLSVGFAVSNDVDTGYGRNITVRVVGRRIL